MSKAKITAGRFSLGSSILALVLMQSSPSWAQQTPAADDEATLPAKPGTAKDAEPQEAIVVTGTRITRPDLQTASPITSFDRKSIVLSGKTNLTDFLSQSPALIGSSDSNANAGSNAGIGATGLNLLDLRNLGTDRTLVLIDGKRHVPSVPGSAAIDVNSIPTDLVERVDIVTGGASAVYGADGVSGVVNFITRRDFQGISARGQVGISDRGDSGNRFASITAGTNFADDRGNIAVNYEYNKDDRLNASQRSELQSANRLTFARNPNDTADSPTVPDRIPLRDVRFFDSSRGGAVIVDFNNPNNDFRPTLLFDGSPFNRGTFVPNFFQQGGSGTPTSDYIGDLLPENTRHAVNAFLSYNLTDSIRFFAQGKYVNTKSFSISQPTFDFGLFLAADNPYLPASLQPFADSDGGILVNRDNFDLGTRGENIKRETIRSVVGFDGKIGDHAKFEASYVYGQSKSLNRQIGNRFNDRFFAAIDAVRDGRGNIVCRSNIDPTTAPPFGANQTAYSFTPGANSGCVPLNILGEGSPSAAAINFVTTTSRATSLITQNVVSGSINGDFGQFFELPGGAIGFAFGAEYRKETSRSTPAPEDTAGQTFGNVIFPSFGQYSVKEGFAELNAPILKDLPFAHELTVGAAIRFSDYSTVGKTTTWKADITYSPIRDIKFRGTIAEAVRAPNIGELFSPASQTFEFITDPCDAGELANGTSTRTANCATLLRGLGVANPATFNDTASASLPGFSSGNARLVQETAKTKTLGVVLQPSFIPKLSIAVDAYDIKLENAVNTVSAQQLADLCVDQATIVNPFCTAITRQNGGANAGRITNFVVAPQNVANFRTRGIDFTFNYSFNPGNIGNFNFRLVGGYLDRLEFIGSPGSTPTDSQGRPGSPKWVVNADLTYTKGPLTLNYGINYFSKTLRFSKILTAAQPDIVDPQFLFLKAKWEHDIQASVNVGDDFSIYAGANNVWNQKADVGQDLFPISAQGRFLYLGVTTKLDTLFK